MAPAGESDELADERWGRGLRRRDGEGVEAAVAVLFRLASGKRRVHAAWSSTVALLCCRVRRGCRSSSHR